MEIQEHLGKFPMLAVRGIITDKDNRVLLLRRANTKHHYGGWCLPGGKIDFGLTVQQALVKEVKEETNIECDSVRFLFFQDNLPTPTLSTHFVTLYFKCYGHGSIKLNEESSDFAWVGPSEFEKFDVVFMNDLAIKEFWAKKE